MSHFEIDWPQIYAHGWQPEESPKAVVCLVHGLGEHSSRYAHVAIAFNQAGISFLTFDLPGHGKSPGKRGHIDSVDALLDHIDTLLTEASRRYPQLPCFLYGHSMGGNLALNYVLHHKPTLTGVIVTAPWLGLTHPPAPAAVKLVGSINRIWPSLTFPSRLNPQFISRNPEMVKAYQTDPLIHDRVSVRLAFSLNKSAEWILSQAAAFHLPLLLIHGSNDQLTNPQTSQQFANAMPGDCTFYLWPNLYHEIHHEPEKEQVISTMVAWVEGRI